MNSEDQTGDTADISQFRRASLSYCSQEPKFKFIVLSWASPRPSGKVGNDRCSCRPSRVCTGLFILTAHGGVQH